MKGSMMGESPVPKRWGFSPRRAMRDRLIVAFGGMLLPVVGLAVVALMVLASVYGSFQYSETQDTQATVPLLRLQASVTAGAGVNVVLRTSPDAPVVYMEQVRAVEKAFAANGHSADPQIAGAVATAHAGFVKATAVITAWMALPVQQQAAAANTARAAFASRIDQARAALTPAIARSEALASAALSHSRTAVSVAGALIAATALAALIAALVIATRLARSVLSPLAGMRVSLARLGSGDLGHRLSLNRHDEFAEVASTVNAMASRLEQQHDVLLHRLSHDDLTGLGNRAMLGECLARVVARPDTPGSVAAVLLIDLDDFKTVNDGLGHAVGDELLRAVAGRLAASTRSADTAVRLGGDEFAVLLDGVSGISEAKDAAQRLLDLLEQPFALSGRQLQITAGIGIAVADPAAPTSGDLAASRHGQTPNGDSPPRAAGTFGAEQLMQGADLAMSAAKRDGRNQIRTFEPAMLAALSDRMVLEAELRAGIAAGQLRVYYQPIIDLATGRAYGSEALVRWQHPTRGLVAPDVFIPVAEQTGLILSLTPVVLDTALAQVAHWRQQGLWPTGGRLAVNISPRHLQHPGLPQLIFGCLSAAGLTGDVLTAEITETALLTADGAHAVATLTELRQAGIRLAIDDFGTGYSNLTRLEHYPIDTLKIDRSFLAALLDGHDAPLAASVISLGNALGLRTIAEGVETLTQATWLRAHGCSHGQGYLYDRPLTATHFTEQLTQQAKNNTWPLDPATGFAPPELPAATNASQH